MVVVVGAVAWSAACSQYRAEQSPSVVVSCDEAERRVRVLIDAHPGGLSTLAPDEREELQRLIEAVEAACSPERATRFGTEVLEPWTR